jgi:hypothetical protein
VKTRVLVTAALLCLSAAHGEAQAARGNEAVGRCSEAQRVLARAGTAAEFRASLPRLIGTCHANDVKGRALASALLRTRQSRDTTILEQLWGQTYWLLDARLFGAAEVVAADPDASVPARIHALHTLLLVGRLDLSPDSESMLAGVDRPSRCLYSRRIHRYAHVGQPIVGDVVPRVARIAGAVYGDSTQPAALRLAAECVYHNIDPMHYPVKAETRENDVIPRRP